MNRLSKSVLWTILLASSLLVNAFSQTRDQAPTVRRAAVSTTPLAQLNGALQQLVKNVSPAVVQIEVSGFGHTDDGSHRQASLIVRQHGIGAGVIVSPDGYIMTNAHVIEGAQRIRVSMMAPVSDLFEVSSAGRKVLDARVIGVHRESDLALLKVEAQGLPTLRFRLDTAPQPGELVFAVGSPEGLQNSATMGVISAAMRQPDPDNPMVYLQTDTPINPGNSGGPLVDVSGAVVGLNTFIMTSTGGSEGLGFAIPARVVDFIYQGLRQDGQVHHVEIGVAAQTITAAMAKGLGLAQNWGVMITDVTPQGPADLAGIRAEDVVLQVDGQPVLGLPGFNAALYLHRPGEDVSIEILRGTQKRSIKVAAAVARDRMEQLADVADPVKGHIPQLGILGFDMKENLFPDARLNSGVIVIGVARGFNSTETGLRPGDVIHGLNRSPIQNLEQLRSALAGVRAGDATVLQIERQGRFQYLAFEME